MTQPRLRRRMRRMSRKKSRCTHPLDALPDGMFDDVVEELKEHRERWAWVDPSISNFDVVQLGGRWTKFFCDVSFNGACGMARGQEVKDWCILNCFPRQRAFMYSAWGEEDANALAREYCRRGQHFYNCWRLRDPELEFRWEPYHLAAYAEGDEFVRWAAGLDAHSDAFAMVLTGRREWTPRNAK